MAANALIQTRVEQAVKDEAARVLKQAGLTVSDAVRLMLVRVVQEGTLPFEIARPNAKTRAAMAEADELIRTRRSRFASTDEMFDALDEDAGER